jgi:HAD superfamily hydrolase (TIGR01490 family)
MSAAAQKIGAFFDIDGTLLSSPSLEWRFISWLESYGALGFCHIARWTSGVASSLLTGELSALRRNKTYLAGLPTQLVRHWESSLSEDALAAFSQGAERVVWHLRQNHRVFLISGTLAPLAEIFARHLGNGIHAYATNLEMADGCWTGSIADNHMSGPEKANTLERIAASNRVSLAESFAYGNEISDLPMLERVGNPVTVNPSPGLRRVAARRRWRIARWNSLQSTGANAADALLSPTEAR